MPITDLTNTKWLISTFPTITSGYGTFSVNCITKTEWDESSGGYVDKNYEMIGLGCRIISGLDYADEISLVDSNQDEFRWYDEYWTDESESYRTITITGGTDATNSRLIAWLEANATQIIEPEPEPTVQAVSSSFKSIAITEHETYITLEFNGEEYDLELSSPLSSHSANKIVFGSFAQVSITDNVLTIGDKSYELVANTPTPTLISFSISYNGVETTYQAEEGMTWNDFAASSYNTDDDVAVDGTTVRYPKSGSVRVEMYKDSTAQHSCLSTDTLVADYVYYATAGGD